MPASEAERLHAASVINSDRKRTFFYPRYGWQDDIFTIFSFSNLIYSLVTPIRKCVFRTNGGRRYNSLDSDIFCQFSQLFPIFIYFDIEIVAEYCVRTFNKENCVCQPNIFLVNCNSIVQAKLLSMTYWYSERCKISLQCFNPENIVKIWCIFLFKKIMKTCPPYHMIYIISTSIEHIFILHK